MKPKTYELIIKRKSSALIIIKVAIDEDVLRQIQAILKAYNIKNWTQ
jgi:predicted transcriptional regulator